MCSVDTNFINSWKRSALVKMGSNLLRYLMCRQFRTYSLVVLTTVLICQSFLVYYILAKVKETEGPSQMESATIETISKEKELGYVGKFPCDITTKTPLNLTP